MGHIYLQHRNDRKRFFKNLLTNISEGDIVMSISDISLLDIKIVDVSANDKR